MKKNLKEAPSGFGKKAGKILGNLYTPVGARTTSQKITVLKRKFGGMFNFHACPSPTGGITDKMKLGCLEYKYLESVGAITTVRV